MVDVNMPFYAFFMIDLLLNAKFYTCLLPFVRISDYVWIHKDYVKTHVKDVRELK